MPSALRRDGSSSSISAGTRLLDGQLERRFRVEIASGTLAGAESPPAGGTDHGCIVGAQTGTRHEQWDAERSSAGGDPLAKHRVGRDATTEDDRARADSFRSAD